MKKTIMTFGVVAIAIIATAAYKDSRYEKVLAQSSVIQETVDTLVGAKPKDVISTLGTPTETTEWGDNANPLLVYKIDEKSKLTVYVASERVVKALLIVMSN